MLVIRGAQLRAFQATRDEAFAAWAVGYLRMRCAEATGDLRDDELARRALVGLRRARLAGFVDAAQVAEYLVLMFHYAPNFAAHPEVKAALARDLPREVPLLTLHAAVPESVWAEVRSQRDDQAWEGI